MKITATHNVAGDTATVTTLDKVAMPEVWQNAFFLFKDLSGTVKLMLPIARVASLVFEDNTITI